jgi:predicted lipoprotein with Yx(FWY)xxD motif
MKRLTTSVISVALASTALAACGSTASTSTSRVASTATPTLSVIRVSGLSVLANGSGLPLYTPAQEAFGKVLCTGNCTSFWKPLIVDGHLPRATGSIGTLGVIKRPDSGQMQLTDNSKPLYTFVRDSPGQLTGNGFHDQFGAHRFTWHVVLSSGAVALPAAQATAKTPVQSTIRSYGSPY